MINVVVFGMWAATCTKLVLCESKACLLLVSSCTIAWCFESPFEQRSAAHAGLRGQRETLADPGRVDLLVPNFERP